MSSSSLINNPEAINAATETSISPSLNTRSSLSQQNVHQQGQADSNNVGTLYINDDDDVANDEENYIENFTRTKIFLCTTVVLVIFLVIVDFSTYHFIGHFFNFVLSWIEDNPIPGFLLSIVIYFISTILFIPVAILALGSAFVFSKDFGLVMGVLLTTIAVYIGASTGAMISFLLGRYLFRDPANRMAANYTFLQAINSAMQDKGFRIMFLLHLSPIIPFGALNYIAGITAVSFSAYYASLLAILPGTIFYSFIGASAGSLTDSSTNAEKYELIGIAIGLFLAICGLIVISYYTRIELAKVQENCEDTNVSRSRQNSSDDITSIC